MTTQTTIGNCTLYLGDCMDVLESIPLHYAGTAVVTDPPYGLGETNERALSRGKLAAPKDYGHFEWDNEPPSKMTINACRLRGKYQVIFGGNYFELPPTKCWLVWDKMQTGDFADCELAWTNLDMAVRRIKHLWNGMIRKDQEERFHPTQKPLGVMRWVLGFLPDSVTIFDPFMGSGTTGVAAAKMGKKFIGIEREQQYFDVACKRIESAYKQPDLFVAQPKKMSEQEDLSMLALRRHFSQ